MRLFFTLLKVEFQKNTPSNRSRPTFLQTVPLSPLQEGSLIYLLTLGSVQGRRFSIDGFREQKTTSFTLSLRLFLCFSPRFVLIKIGSEAVPNPRRERGVAPGGGMGTRGMEFGGLSFGLAWDRGWELVGIVHLGRLRKSSSGLKVQLGYSVFSIRSNIKVIRFCHPDKDK